jgi:hypothetical protein
LKNILITKFRGKFGVTGNGTSDSDFIDQTIKSEVETFLIQEQMTEANLIKLDKRITELVNGKVGGSQ